MLLHKYTCQKKAHRIGAPHRLQRLLPMLDDVETGRAQQPLVLLRGAEETQSVTLLDVTLGHGWALTWAPLGMLGVRCA